MLASFFGAVTAQTEYKNCEQCGMKVDTVGQARFVIVDSNGDNHIACCPICALKMLKDYSSLAISSFCDCLGPDYPILITATNHGKDVTVNPESALIIAGGSCTKNRIVYGPEAADALLSSPNNGTSRWLSPLTNDPVAKNATRLSINQAAIKYSGITLDSTICETCEMTVSADSQTRYRITDAQGNRHYVECFMCALQLINQYEILHIETTCDWYGPGYPIIIDTTGFGQNIEVSPTTAMYLRGGSCVLARAAYNQSAADNLLAYGFSSNTSPEQQYTLPTRTDVVLVRDAIQTWYARDETIDNTISTNLVLIIAIAIGVVIVVVSLLAFRTLRRM